jgi:hypothetical protein
VHSTGGKGNVHSAESAADEGANTSGVAEKMESMEKMGQEVYSGRFDKSTGNRTKKC